jgi:hypothetical protein
MLDSLIDPKQWTLPNLAMIGFSEICQDESQWWSSVAPARHTATSVFAALTRITLNGAGLLQ